MSNGREITTGKQAVAYYRHSALDPQENSIRIQRERVRRRADELQIKIIHEFVDAGKSGLNAEGRPAFAEMMEEWVKKRNDFRFVLCLDVSRWGRFRDIDLSAHYSAECQKYGKLAIFIETAEFTEDDPLYPVYVDFERLRAAQGSRELSDRVWRNCSMVTSQGVLSVPIAANPAPLVRQPSERNSLFKRLLAVMSRLFFRRSTGGSA
jgi:hypothetical protein